MASNLGPHLLTPAQVANRIAGYTAGLPKPLTDQQISARAQALLDPLVKQTTDRINASTKAGAGAISGYASKYADALAGYGDSAKAIYGGAEQSQAAADAAESGALRTGGSQLADQLAGKIGQISSAPNVMQAGTAPVVGNAAGAANATLGSGSAALSALIAQGAAAQEYAGKLPGIARAQGASDIRDLSLASQKTLADQIGELEKQTPGLIESLRSQSDQRASNIASTRNQAAQYYDTQNRDTAKFLKAEQDAGINATTKANAAVTTAKIKANTAAQAALAKQSNTDFNQRIAFAKAYGYDPVTNQTLPGFTRNAKGDVVKVSTSNPASKKKGALTDAQINDLVAKWHNGRPVTQSVKQPKPDANGNDVYRKITKQTGQVSYQQAYKMLRLYGKSDQEARAVLNTQYGRGDTGRGWLTNEEQATLRKAGRQPSVGMYQGHAFIAPPQVAALSKAGLLPPGEMVNHRYFIKPGQ